MSEMLMEILHLAPLALIALAVLGSGIYKAVAKKSVDSGMLHTALLVLCSVGIVAGNFVHHGELLHLLDPCYGYAATLMGIAFSKSAKHVKSRA